MASAGGTITAPGEGRVMGLGEDLAHPSPRVELLSVWASLGNR